LLALDNGAAERHLDVELSVHVRLRKAVAGRVEQAEQLLIGEVELFRQARAILVVLLQAKRVNIRDQVPMRHEGSQEHLQPGQVIGLPLLICAAQRLGLILEGCEDHIEVIARVTNWHAAEGRWGGEVAIRCEVGVPASVNR